jgi:hypothetical protein
MVLRAGFKKKKGLCFELMICDKYRGKNTSPQCVNILHFLFYCYILDLELFLLGILIFKGLTARLYKSFGVKVLSLLVPLANISAFAPRVNAKYYSNFLCCNN